MKFFKALKQFLLKYKHGLVLSYFFIYMAWFTYLERTVTSNFTIIHSRLDDLIPFNEWFAIPYFLWFVYIAVTVVYFLFTSKNDFYKYCAFLFIGMTICLIIYTIFPNGQDLRVDVNSLGRHNIMIDIMSKLYKIDTDTNVFPSIHAYNSIGAYIAIRKSEKLHSKKWLQRSSLILTILICMSTVFLKQHSVLDVFGACVLSIVMYTLVYVPDWTKVFKPEKQPELSKVRR